MEELQRVKSEEGLLNANAELDLRGVMCPFNFVKTKLKLEDMDNGSILAVTLDQGEPLENVPASLEHEGHVILRIEPRDTYACLWVRKQGPYTKHHQ